mmetsp:Transcript_9263/g.28533  ORF Transcript_9263/g.28533 Transcript_9263/m.28533 type:complete len:327 (-) Transcript_9263:169-1149(-)
MISTWKSNSLGRCLKAIIAVMSSRTETDLKAPLRYFSTGIPSSAITAASAANVLERQRSQARTTLRSHVNSFSVSFFTALTISLNMSSAETSANSTSPLRRCCSTVRKREAKGQRVRCSGPQCDFWHCLPQYHAKRQLVQHNLAPSFLHAWHRAPSGPRGGAVEEATPVAPPFCASGPPPSCSSGTALWPSPSPATAADTASARASATRASSTSAGCATVLPSVVAPSRSPPELVRALSPSKQSSKRVASPESCAVHGAPPLRDPLPTICWRGHSMTNLWRRLSMRHTAPESIGEAHAGTTTFQLGVEPSLTSLTSATLNSTWLGK